MASILRLRPSLRPPTNPSSLFLRLPPSYRSFHASPRPQFLDLQSVLSGTHTALDFIHTSSGLPWVLSIPLAALMMRVTIMLPVSIYTRRCLQKSAELNPALHAWGHHFRRSVMRNDRGATPGYVERRAKEALRSKRREVHRRWGIQFWKQLFPPMIQVPVWLTLVETIRRMCGTETGILGLFVPDGLRTVTAKMAEAAGVDKLSDITLVQGSGDASVVLSGPELWVESGFKTEGMLWFQNLLLADPYGVLPMLLSGALVVTLITPYRKRSVSKSRAARGFHRGLILAALVVAPLTMQMPAAILVYWISSISFGIIQNHLVAWFIPVKEPVRPCQPVGKHMDQVQSADLLSKLDSPPQHLDM